MLGDEKGAKAALGTFITFLIRPKRIYAPLLAQERLGSMEPYQKSVDGISVSMMSRNVQSHISLKLQDAYNVVCSAT